MLRSFAVVASFWAIAANAFLTHLDLPYEQSEFVKVSAITERSENGDRRLHVRAFGEDHHVTLTAANDIFSPDFRAYSAETAANGEVTFQSTTAAEEKLQSSTKEAGYFYSVTGSHSAGSVFVRDSSDGLKVEGLLNDRLLIVPHASASQDGDLHNHVVYQLRNAGDDYENDTLIPPTNPSPVPITTRQSGSVPSTVTVEVLVLFDHLNTKALNFDQDKIRQYIGVFWNFIQNRYASATSPNVKIAISGLLTFNSDNDQPFLKDKKIDNLRVYDNFLGDLRSWLQKGTRGLPKNDVVMLHTSLDAGTVSGGQFHGSVAGKAYIGTTCSNTDGYNSGFSEDKAPFFTGMLTAAHELGHLLNLEHDGTGNGAGCSNGDGYIMASHGGGQRQYQFSSCSLTNLRSFVSRNDKKCLWDSPLNQVSLSTKSPASFSSNLDDQCKRLFEDDNYYFRQPATPQICKWMYCTSKAMNGAGSAKGGALEGTPCDVGKMCIEGECRPNGVASLDQQCKYFGQEFTAYGKEDANICSRLWCTKDNYHLTSIGGAADGSTCGSYGSCLSQQCINQVPNLEDQCKTRFGTEYYAYNKDKSDEVCSRLWCTKDGRGLTSGGGAAPNSGCASGKVCRNNQCITA